MKAVVLVLAIAAAVSANPINRKSKWEEIGDQVEGIRGNVGNAVADIKQIANDANPQVGQQISEFLDDETPDVISILKEVTVQIDAQTVTIKQAKEHFSQSEALLIRIYDSLRNFLSKLPQNAQFEINDVLDKNFVSIREKMNNTFNLLKWDEIRDLLKHIGVQGRITIAGVESVAIGDRHEIGEQITAYFNEKVPEAIAIFEKIIRKIDAENLTYNHASDYFKQLETWVRKAKLNLRESVVMLHPNAEKEIKSMVESNTKSIKEKVDQIFSLLK